MNSRRRTVAVAVALSVVLALLPVGPASAAAPAPVSAPATGTSAHVAGLDDLHLVAEAIRRENGRILLVDRHRGDIHGAAWTAEPIDLTSFTLTSAFHVRGRCADGLAVVIQGEGPDAIGSIGGTLGYGRSPDIGIAGITHSLAIELDSYRNPGEPRTPNLSLQTRGPLENDSSPEYSLLVERTKPVNDGKRHVIVVTYTGGVLTVSYAHQPLVEQAIDLDELLGLDGGPAYLGWTSSNGGCASNTVITQFELTL